MPLDRRANSRAEPIPRTHAYNHSAIKRLGSVASRPATPSRALIGWQNPDTSRCSTTSALAAPDASPTPDRPDIRPPSPSAAAPAAATAPPTRLPQRLLPLPARRASFLPGRPAAPPAPSLTVNHLPA